MKASSKARYSLRLAMDIALFECDGPVSLSEVSRRQGISLKYLEQLATALTRKGYLKSVRGQAGGYLLACPPSQITAGDIIRAAEGGFISVSCLEDDAALCPLERSCGSASFWSGLHSAIDTYLDSVALDQLMQKPLTVNDPALDC